MNVLPANAYAAYNRYSSGNQVTTLPADPTATTGATYTGDAAKDYATQKQETKAAAKEVSEVVYISNEAQQMMQVYAASYSGTAPTESVGQPVESVETGDVVKATQEVQQRQTRMAMAEYKQQQAMATPEVPDASNDNVYVQPLPSKVQEQQQIAQQQQPQEASKRISLAV